MSVRRRASRAPVPDAPEEVEAALIRVIHATRPAGLCDSCLALDIHVSGAETHAAAIRLAVAGEVERAVGRCDRCKRTVEVTRAGSPHTVGDRP